MNLRKLLPLFASLLLAATAHAQLGIYATATAQRMTNIAYTTGNSSSSNAQINPVGGTFGVYYDFKQLGPVRLGVDARGVVTHASRGAFAEANGFGSRINSVLGGVRLSFKTPLALFRPYVEGVAGMGRSNYGIQYAANNNLEYHGYAGLDLRITPLLDIRAAELGYGGLSSSSPSSHQYPIESVSTGIVLRLPF
jgi:hypothetical protein